MYSLPLGHFVDHVDGVGSLFAFLFGRVHGVDAQVSRTPARLRLAAFADRHRRGSGLVEMQTVPPVNGSFAQVVEVPHRQLGEALKFLAAVELELAFEDTASGRPGKALMNAVDMREENDVGTAVLGGKTAPPIGRRTHATLAQELSDQAGQLGPAQAGELAQKAPQQSLDEALLVGIVMPLQNGFDERLFLRSIAGGERDGFTPVEKTLDLLETQRFGLLHGDSHRPQLARFESNLPRSPPGSSCIGIAPPFRLILYWIRWSWRSSARS